MSQFININSQLDALRIKEFEEKFYEKISDNVKIVPKVTPFKGINTDLLYIKDNKILFVKFMDTSEDLFSILDEELIEVMNEENEFSSTFISKYDIGIHSSSYKIIIKSEYQESIDYLEMDMPTASTITSLYITMDNYNFIVGLFNGTELISKQTLDINQYNQFEDFLN